MQIHPSKRLYIKLKWHLPSSFYTHRCTCNRLASLISNRNHEGFLNSLTNMSSSTNMGFAQPVVPTSWIWIVKLVGTSETIELPSWLSSVAVEKPQVLEKTTTICPTDKPQVLEKTSTICSCHRQTTSPSSIKIFLITIANFSAAMLAKLVNNASVPFYQMSSSALWLQNMPLLSRSVQIPRWSSCVTVVKWWIRPSWVGKQLVPPEETRWHTWCNSRCNTLTLCQSNLKL